MHEFSHSTDDVTTSLAFRFMIDQALVANRDGQLTALDVYARAAEGLVKAMLPDHSKVIAAVASRKVAGREIGLALAQRLSPAAAAAVNVVWLLRDARRTSTDAISEAFRQDAVFDDTVRSLCARIFTPTTVVAPGLPMSAKTIEVASAYRY